MAFSPEHLFLRSDLAKITEEWQSGLGVPDDCGGTAFMKPVETRASFKMQEINKEEWQSVLAGRVDCGGTAAPKTVVMTTEYI